MKPNLKQIVSATVAVGMLTAASYSSALAQKVGDKMPTLDKYVVDVGRRIQIYWDKIGYIESLKEKGAEEAEYKRIYLICDGIRADNPYGLYNFETNVLYLDNAPTDGIIDEIIENASSLEKPRYLYQDAPDCK